MSDTKVLKAITNVQSVLHQLIITEIKGVREDIKRLDIKIDGVEERLTARINKIGSQLAFLEDDTPTREEHDNLEKRVGKIEKTISS